MSSRSTSAPRPIELPRRSGGRREICIAALMQALALIFLDPESGLRLAEESIETSRAAGFMWAEGIASTVAGILHGVTPNPDSSQARHSEAIELYRRSLAA